jgi:hypothetical protein
MTKQKMWLYGVLILVLGLAIGHATGMCWSKQSVKMGMHRMPNGSMMRDDGHTMSGTMDGMMAELEGKSGDEFDKAFLSGMIVHHEGAVAMAESARQNASHQEIKTMANAIISTQTTEITQMKTWLKTWYGIETNLNSGEGAPVGSIHNLPVPPGVSAARRHVAQNLKIAEGKVVIMTAYEKEWSDSCLALGGPAESCAAVITPGYEVTMQAEGKTYVYRTNTAGTIVRSEK